MTDDKDGSVARHPSGLDPAGATRRRHGRRWVLLGGVLGAISLLTLLLAFGLRRDPTLVPSVLVGRPAPEFSLPMLDGAGRTISSSGLRGQVVVVNFFASWCAECRQEHDALAAAWERYRDQGVVFVGIPFQDTVANSRAFAAELAMDWPLVSDPSDRTALDYGVLGVPETFFISPSGIVRYRWEGPIDYATLTDRIDQLLRVGAKAR